MTKREAAIVSAYTGYMLGDFNDMHRYAEEVMKSPILSSTFGRTVFAQALREAAKPDFVALEVSDASCQAIQGTA